MKGGTLLLLGLGALLLFGMNKQTEPGTETTEQQTLLQAWIDRIKATPEWYALILQKAQSTGFTIEQQLAHDAQWMIDQGHQL